MRAQKATHEQLAALRNAIGGYSTVSGAPKHRLFEGMRCRGWVREYASTTERTVWQITADGLNLAYPTNILIRPRILGSRR